MYFIWVELRKKIFTQIMQLNYYPLIEVENFGGGGKMVKFSRPFPVLIQIYHATKISQYNRPYICFQTILIILIHFKV